MRREGRDTISALYRAHLCMKCSLGMSKFLDFCLQGGPVHPSHGVGYALEHLVIVTTLPLGPTELIKSISAQQIFLGCVIFHLLKSFPVL